VIPLPPGLITLLSALPRRAECVFPNRNGKRLTHLLRRLKAIAKNAKVRGATLHKFRQTYGTRLLERGADIVPVQKLMGHNDIETTRKYLNPEDALKRKAANRLSIEAPPEEDVPKRQPGSATTIDGSYLSSNQVLSDHEQRNVPVHAIPGRQVKHDVLTLGCLARDVLETLIHSVRGNPGRVGRARSSLERTS
jgi:hypothetical protein